MVELLFVYWLFVLVVCIEFIFLVCFGRIMVLDGIKEVRLGGWFFFIGGLVYI